MSELPRRYGVAADDRPLIGADEYEPVAAGEPACHGVVGRQQVIPSHERDNRAFRVPGRRADLDGFGLQVHDHDGRIAGVAHTWMIIPQTITVPREIP
jgi:hypothetical protein